MSRLPWTRLRPLWVAAALALAARAEAARRPAGPEAWTANFSYGGGNVSLEGDSLGRDVGLMSKLSLGHVLRPGLIAGFQLRSWSAAEKDSVRQWTDSTPEGVALEAVDLTRNVTIITMTATLYPKGTGGYVRGGVGVCRVRQEFLHHYTPPQTKDFQIPSVQETHEDVGFAVEAAGGWEYRLRAHLGVVADVEYSRFVANHVGGNLFSYTAGLNYYW